MKSNIAASRLKVGGSLGFPLHLSAHVSMLCSFVFEQNGAMQRLHSREWKRTFREYDINVNISIMSHFDAFYSFILLCVVV